MLECWHIISGSLVKAPLGEAGGHLEATGHHAVAAVGTDEWIRLVGIRGHLDTSEILTLGSVKYTGLFVSMYAAKSLTAIPCSVRE